MTINHSHNLECEPQPKLSLALSAAQFELELNFLGAIMLDNALGDTLSSEGNLRLNPSVFLSHSHALIYMAMLELNEARKPMDVVTLAEHMEQQSKLNLVGGLKGLGHIAMAVTSWRNFDVWVDLLTDFGRLHLAPLAVQHSVPVALEEAIHRGWRKTPAWIGQSTYTSFFGEKRVYEGWVCNVFPNEH